jgi:hypothetical protein
MHLQSSYEDQNFEHNYLSLSKRNLSSLSLGKSQKKGLLFMAAAGDTSLVLKRFKGEPSIFDPTFWEYINHNKFMKMVSIVPFY